MTEIERKALALVREVLTERNLSEKRAVRREVSPYTEALCRAIEQHEAFRQEVSDAMKLLSEEHEAFKQEVSDAVEKLSAAMLSPYVDELLARFIITKPVDPLVEAMQEWWDADGYADIETFRAAIEKRGGKIVWGEGA